MSGAGGRGQAATGRKPGISLSSVRWADPTDENRDAFALASCSLPVLKYKIPPGHPGHPSPLLGSPEVEPFPGGTGWNGCTQAVASSKP